MTAIFAFKCRTCGEIHGGSPSFSYPHPWHYATLAEEDKKQPAALLPDTLNLKAKIRPRKGGTRPCPELERNGHLLAEHLYEGIGIQLAQEIAEHAQHRS